MIFFLKNLKILNFLKQLKILIDDFFFFWKQCKKYEPNAPSSKALFENFLLYFLFFWNMKICSLSKSEEDEDKDGVKVMNIYSWWFFFFFFIEKPIIWMRITLAGSWCGLLSPCLIPAKRQFQFSNGFIHWNELEVLSQCP